MARENLEKRRALRWHVSAFLIVNIAMVLLWLVTTGPSGTSWPVYLLIAWGIGLTFHVLSMRDHDPTAEEIESEARRIAERARGANRGARRTPPEPPHAPLGIRSGVGRRTPPPRRQGCLRQTET